MYSTEPKAPSIGKAALVFALTAVLLALSSRAPAQEPSPAARAYAGQPSVRIRGVDTSGLSPASFAGWIAAHRDIRGLPTAALFSEADANRDGRVTAIELKDLLMRLEKA